MRVAIAPVHHEPPRRLQHEEHADDIQLATRNTYVDQRRQKAVRGCWRDPGGVHRRDDVGEPALMLVTNCAAMSLAKPASSAKASALAMRNALSSTRVHPWPKQSRHTRR